MQSIPVVIFDYSFLYLHLIFFILRSILHNYYAKFKTNSILLTHSNEVNCKLTVSFSFCNFNIQIEIRKL